MNEKHFSLSQNEWLVMEALWKSPSTLMELVHILEQEPTFWAKSTTATMVRRMEEKGLIYHKTEGRTKIFLPSMPREKAVLAETRTLIDKVFDGSAGLLISTLIRRESLSRDEINSLYEILRQSEEEQEGSQ